MKKGIIWWGFLCITANLCPNVAFELSSGGSVRNRSLLVATTRDDFENSPIAPTRKLSWFERAQQVKEYRDLHGDCLVPKNFNENPGLGAWVNKQRQKRKRGDLAEIQIRHLDEIGFVWDASKSRYSPNKKAEAWWRRFRQFEEELASESGVDLKSSWIAQQRREFASFKAGEASQLTDEMVEAMEASSFNWKPLRQQTWDQRIKELIEYKDKFGDCMVPINYEENRKLAVWVNNQRKRYRSKLQNQSTSLTDEQIDQLENIGFVWNRWDHEFDKLGIDLEEQW